MLNPFYLFSAFVAFQWTAAEPTSTSFIDRTRDDPLNKSTLVPHLKIDEVNTLRVFGLRDRVQYKDDQVHPNNEERKSWPLVTSALATLESSLSRYKLPIRRSRNTVPVNAPVKNDALNENLAWWIPHLKWIVDRSSTHIAYAAVRLLGAIMRKKYFVVTLLRSRNVDGMKEFSYRTLRWTAESNQDTAKLVLDTCLEARVHPEEVVHMLPLSEDILKLGVQDGTRYSKIDEHLTQWLMYVSIFNNQQSREASGRIGPGESYSYDPYRPEPYIVDTLMSRGKPKDVVTFFEYLRRKKHRGGFAENAQQRLLSKHRKHTETMIFTLWKKVGLSPSIAYQSMPFGAINQHFVAMKKITTDDICAWLKQVMTYQYLYRGSSFSGNEVLGLLHTGRSYEEVMAYLMLLHGVNGHKDARLNIVLNALNKAKPLTDEVNIHAKVMYDELVNGRPPW